MEERKDSIEINLSQCFSILLKKCYWIIACALICALAGFLYTWKCTVPLYQSNVKLNVNIIERAEGNGVIVLSSASQTRARSMVNNYIVILQSNQTNKMVYEAAKEKRPDLMANIGGPGVIGGMISAGALNETEIFQVTVTDTLPARAALIAQTVAEILTPRVQEIISGTSVSIVDNASWPAPVSQGYTTNTVLGAFVGAVISAAFILWRAFSNPFVQDEENITTLYGLPVLSVIPNLAESHDSGNYSYYYSYGKKQKKQDGNASDIATL